MWFFRSHDFTETFSNPLPLLALARPRDGRDAPQLRAQVLQEVHVGRDGHLLVGGGIGGRGGLVVLGLLAFLEGKCYVMRAFVCVF